MEKQHGEIGISERLVSIPLLVGICHRCGESTAYVTELSWPSGLIEYHCPHCRCWLGRKR